MRKYILVASFFLTLVILDLSVGAIMRKTYFKIKSGDIGRINAILKDTSKIIILGSSRATHHYDPAIFSEALNLSTYNGGLDGSTVIYSYAVLAERIKTIKPKIVILDIHRSINDPEKTRTGLCEFLPYTNDFETFREIVKIDTKYAYLRELIQSSKYNSVLHNLVSDRYTPEKDPKGYLPLKGKLHGPPGQNLERSKNRSVDSLQWLYLNKIVTICHQNDIACFFVISPMYYKNFPASVKKSLAELSTEQNVAYFDFSSIPFYNFNDTLFKDAVHMNAVGAKMFSTELAILIKSALVDENIEKK